MIDLYIISLFWSGILELRNCRRRRSLLFAGFLFSFRWGPQVSFLSSVMPKYLISVWTGMGALFMINWGQNKRGECFNVKVTCTDLSVLIFIFHFLAHSSILLVWSWSAAEARIGFGLEERIAVSSAYVARRVLLDWGMSAVNTL